MDPDNLNRPKNRDYFRLAFRVLLGVFLMTAGTGHLTWSRLEFRAQVPKWLPFNEDLIVLLSGVFEILLGIALAFINRRRHTIGWIAALGR